MALPVIDHVYRCTVNQTSGAFPMANVFHVFNSSDPDPLDVAAAVGQAWADSGNIAAVQDTGVLYTTSDVIPLDGATASASWNFSLGGNINGDHTGGPVPPQVAMTISIQTALRGRSHRGRLYLGGLSDPYFDESTLQWSDDAVSETQTHWDNFISDLAGGSPNLFFGVASYVLADFNIMTSSNTNHALGTQRMRART